MNPKFVGSSGARCGDWVHRWQVLEQTGAPRSSQAYEVARLPLPWDPRAWVSSSGGWPHTQAFQHKTASVHASDKRALWVAGPVALLTASWQSWPGLWALGYLVLHARTAALFLLCWLCLRLLHVVPLVCSI